MKELLEKINTSLRSDDPRFRNSVKIIHQDGSFMHFTHAFMLRLRNWLLVFTEHLGSHSFNVNDLFEYKQLKFAEKPEVINSDGEIISETTCDFCNKKILIKDIKSIYDKVGNRIDANICQDCEEIPF